MEALYVAFLALCLALLSSCAHDPKLEKKIEAETAAMPTLNDSQRARAAEVTIESASLPEPDKQKLEELAITTNSELQSLREKSAKLRILLVRQLVNPVASDREIDAIEKRILETDQQSSKRWVSALEDARQLLGRKDADDRKYYKAFREEPGEDTGNHSTEK